MTTARCLIVAMGALAALTAANPAHALPVDQYLALRRQSNCDRRLVYSQVESNAGAYVNRVMELRGTVNGAIRREHDVAFLLTLENKHALLLNAPPSDVRMVSEVNNQTVRVLARVTDGSIGNVVPLQVLGVAYDGEVTVKERDAERRLAAEAQREQYRALARRPPTELASRGGYYARPMRQSPAGGVSAQAMRYLLPAAQAIYPAYRNYIARCNPRLTAKELDDITVSLLYFSQHNQVDPRLVVAMIIAESDFDPRSTSNKGAMG